jgi:hypothetical protein
MHSRDPRAEAQQVVGDEYQARVLEPSPPAVDGAPWFADDPVSGHDSVDRRPVVSPVSNGELTWDDWLSGHPDRAAWAAERWLGALRPLQAMPPALVPTRLGLHRLAVYVLAPARRRANGRIGLRWTYGGFGTPFFGSDEQVRVAGTELVHQHSEGAAAEPITSLSHAAAFVLEALRTRPGPRVSMSLPWASPKRAWASMRRRLASSKTGSASPGAFWRSCGPSPNPSNPPGCSCGPSTSTPPSTAWLPSYGPRSGPPPGMPPCPSPTCTCSRWPWRDRPATCGTPRPFAAPSCPTASWPTPLTSAEPPSTSSLPGEQR